MMGMTAQPLIFIIAICFFILDNIVMNTVLSAASPVLVLSQHDVDMIITYLVILALVVVLQPLVLSLTFSKRKGLADKPVTGSASSFFEIPFITWYLVHYGIAALAVIAILILALDNVIDKTTVAALLGSLFGYVLGSSSKGSSLPLPAKPTTVPPLNGSNHSPEDSGH